MNGDFELGDWAVHPKLNTVVRNNASRHVSPKAVEVLLFLARHQGDVISKEAIFAAVWSGTFVTDDALTRCIGELRRVFEDDAHEPTIIQTIAKRGYRLVPPVRWLGNGWAGPPNSEPTADQESASETAAEPRTSVSLESAHADASQAGPSGTIGFGRKAPAVAVRRVSRRIAVAVALLTLIAGVVTGVTVMSRLRPVPVSGPVVSTIDLEPGYVLASRNTRADIPTRTAIAISRDGSFLVYCAKREGAAERRLFLRRLTQPHATAIAGTEGAQAPFLSPDDRRVGFVANGQLKWVSIDGGPATVLHSSITAPFGASWGSDGYITFSSGFEVGLYRVRSAGGTAEILTTRLPGEFHHRLPHCLPRGKGVLFTVAALPSDPHPRIAVVDETRRTRILLDDGADARYVATGHLVFVRQGALMAVRFDLDGLRTTGQAIPLGIGVAQAMNGLATTEETDAGQFAVSGAGALVYVTGGIIPNEQHSLVWVEQDGREVGLAVPFTAPFLSARLSPDGRKIAYTVIGTKSQVCVYDVNGGAPSTLTSEGRVNFAIWTRDSHRVVFGLSTSGPPNLFARPVDQSTPAQALTADKTCIGQGPGSFSPNGNLLAFWRQYPDGTNQILILNRESDKTTPFIEGHQNKLLCHPEFSPDGRWLAYTSNESGRREVYVRAYPQGGQWQVSIEGGTEPLWARDRKRLFYRSATEVWAVDLETAAGLRPGKPWVLFSQADKYLSMSPGRTWDLSHDGRRLLMVRREETTPQPVTRLAFIQNWTRGLEPLFETRARER